MWNKRRIDVLDLHNLIFYWYRGAAIDILLNINYIEMNDVFLGSL